MKALRLSPQAQPPHGKENISVVEISRRGFKIQKIKSASKQRNCEHLDEESSEEASLYYLKA